MFTSRQTRAPWAPTSIILLVVYLGATAPLLALGGGTPLRLVALAARIGAVFLLLRLASRRRQGIDGYVERILVDWAPLILVPALYGELPLLMEGLAGTVRYHDPAIARLEYSIFGSQPAFQWAGRWPSRALSELLHACYASYYALIYVPPLLLYLGMTAPGPRLGRGTDAFQDTVLAVQVSFLVCFLAFVFFPVQGPRYFGVPQGVPDGPVRRLVLALLEAGSSRGAAFPSSHVAVATTQFVMVVRYQPRLGLLVFLISLGLAAGAVYGGFHYAVDALAGVAVGTLAVPLAGALRRRLEPSGPDFTSPPGPA